MSAASSQILEAYENLGMTPEQIAENLSFDIIAVKATLMQFSSAYRKAAQKEPDLDFTVDEQLAAKQTMVELMRNTDDEYLKARLAMKIRDDGKGRLDIGTMNGLKINVVQFNVQLQQAREMKERAKLSNPGPPIPNNKNGHISIQEAVEV